jgi:MFS family permease
MFHLPQIYESVIITTFEVTAIEVESLYSIYSIPNFVMTPLGSFLLNYTGLGLGAVLFQSLVVIGSMMIYLGFEWNQFAMLYWGRAVYGLGCEVIIIILATIADKWYSGKMLSIAQTLNKSFASVGVLVALYIGPELFTEYRSMRYPLLCYVIACFISFFAVVIYCVVEHYSDLKIHKSVRKLEKRKELLI